MKSCATNGWSPKKRVVISVSNVLSWTGFANIAVLGVKHARLKAEHEKTRTKRVVSGITFNKDLALDFAMQGMAAKKLVIFLLFNPICYLRLSRRAI